MPPRGLATRPSPRGVRGGGHGELIPIVAWAQRIAPASFGAEFLGGVTADWTWKIDLYEEPSVKAAGGSPVVTRVLTIMLAEEY